MPNDERLPATNQSITYTYTDSWMPSTGNLREEIAKLRERVAILEEKLDNITK